MERKEGHKKKNSTSSTKAVTRERVLELFLYEPQTGLLIRRKSGKAVGIKQQGRSLVNIDGNIISVHRAIWLYMTGERPEQIDHKNGIHWDNRWENLREATNTQNSRNSRIGINNTSGYKGVSFIPRLNKYRAYITVNRKQINLGCYKTAKEAAAVYNEAAKEHFGEFALLNEL
jgi:hypothetical protein